MGILSRIAAAAAALALSVSLHAQEAAPPPGDAKARDIRRLLEVTGAAKLGLQIVDSLLDTQKKALPTVPESFWREFRASLKPEEFAELAVPIYDKHLTHEEIRGLLAFYQSPLGRRLLEVQPLLLQDSIAAGRRWGEGLAKKVLEKLRDKGYGPSGAS
jgi:hypothetical protein